jgi:hypothetical protein
MLAAQAAGANPGVCQIFGAPTTSELGLPDLVSETRFALLKPAGTPAELVTRLNAGLNGIVSAPATGGGGLPSARPHERRQRHSRVAAVTRAALLQQVVPVGRVGA